MRYLQNISPRTHFPDTPFCHAFTGEEFGMRQLQAISCMLDTNPHLPLLRSRRPRNLYHYLHIDRNMLRAQRDYPGIIPKISRKYRQKEKGGGVGFFIKFPYSDGKPLLTCTHSP